MIAFLAFTFIAALLVFAAGRRDAARDPGLTFLLLALLVAFPLMILWMPKLALLPSSVAGRAAEGFPWMAVLLPVWAAGFLISITRLALAALGLRKWKQRSALIGDAAGVPVRRLEGLRSPVAAGIFHPVIFVPENWDAIPEPKRQMILAHELAHHRRRDALKRLCAELACAVHWYHPLVRWMARRFAIQCEFACDAEVLREGADAKDYARLLCDLATPFRTRPLALAMAETPSLERRVSRMMRAGHSSGTVAVYLSTGLGLLAALALAMVDARHESFTPKEVHLRLTADPFPGE
jgi:beta-lactamase regulating signal transducer with metallopeptidase domain